MPLSSFHPAVARWFTEQFGQPSPPQEAGWPHIAAGRDTLICAPTGSGKTLTAFMACLDSLFRQGLEGTLTDRTQVVYVSPLKALSNDIEKNLREPLEGIARVAREMGYSPPDIRVWVRTGDTPAKERQAAAKKPPHILVTTPESLYILLTAGKSREALREVRTIIIDEIHAVARDKRGSHLALSLERLEALCEKRLQRLGLSATQRPVDLVAKFLVGAARLHEDGTPQCEIVDLGHLRKVELTLEVPGSPLEHVCSHETWEDVYNRLTELIEKNRTTLIFVNQRGLCERLAQHLSKRLGDDKVTSHHGSLSRDQRLSSEERLKSGQLRAMVATASLELGIDIGSIDLVCQIGPTYSIGTLMQRIGRSGHSLTGISRGTIFALTLDELGACSALCSAVKRGYMDVLKIPDQPLDILSQQIVAACAAEEWDEDELYATFKRAYPYRDLTRKTYDETVQMLAEGFAVRRGRTGAFIHYDGVGHRLRGRRNARLAAITSGGAIPDNADYLVVQEPEGNVVGTLNEDFAVESTPNDIFQLGNTSWKILKVEQGKVRVEDAHGQPPTIPFWLGEAPARTNELTGEVTRLRAGLVERFAKGGDAGVAWLVEECGIPVGAAEQLYAYLAESFRALGALPTLDTLILERFFDEAGGMQLILHAPFGRRVNWGWGLALRKRFCRGFNFELQAAATENAVLLSLGPQHSFPLEDVFRYLNSNSVEDLLVQAMLEAAVFQTRWRWDAGRSLALLRFSGGKKVPPQIQRMRADDLLAAVFPHAAACPENLDGHREVPDHPLVNEVIKDCMTEAMDLEGLLGAIRRIEAGELRLLAKDTTTPSPLAGEILTAKPYAFLDDAPLEERRTQAVMMRRGGGSKDDADGMGALDEAAIERVRDEAWPDPQDADELHDALMMLGYLTIAEMEPLAFPLQRLVEAGRATRVTLPGSAGDSPAFLDLWIATERLPLFEAIHPTAQVDPAVEVPPRDRAKTWTREDAAVELLRGRLEALGPVLEARLARELGVTDEEVYAGMMMLESQGGILRGHFTPNLVVEPAQPGEPVRPEREWCDRRLLARIHRYTLDRLRREIQPVTAAEYMRFLLSWQHVLPKYQLEGPQGVREVVAQLQGCEVAAVAWERDVLPARVRDYHRAWLDQVSLSGEVSWGRRFPAAINVTGGRHSGQVRHAPIGLFLREELNDWVAMAPPLAEDESHLSGAAQEVLEQLRQKGAVFFQNLVRETRRLPVEIETALGELVAFGYVTGDGFGGLRALLTPASKREEMHRKRRFGYHRISDLSLGETLHGNAIPFGIESAGRWSLFREGGYVDEENLPGHDERVAMIARQLLRRWGVVFHRVIARESGLPPWREILRVYRRMEARGELRGGRFVAGFSGEQYALPEAIEQLRAVRKQEPDGSLLQISAADPLNLIGILVPGDRVAARAATKIVLRDGVPVAVKESNEVRSVDGQNLAGHEMYSTILRTKT